MSREDPSARIERKGKTMMIVADGRTLEAAARAAEGHLRTALGSPAESGVLDLALLMTETCIHPDRPDPDGDRDAIARAVNPRMARFRRGLRGAGPEGTEAAVLGGLIAEAAFGRSRERVEAMRAEAAELGTSAPFERIAALVFDGSPRGVGIMRSDGTASEFAYAWPVLSGDGYPTGAWRTLTGAFDPIDPQSGDMYLDAETMSRIVPDGGPVSRRDLVPLVAEHQMDSRFNVPSVHADRASALKEMDAFANMRADPCDVGFSDSLGELERELSHAMESIDAHRAPGIPERPAPREPLSSRLRDLGADAAGQKGFEALCGWGAEVDAELAGAHGEHVGGFNGDLPCFGDVVRVDDGLFVSLARFETVIPDPAERDAWFLYSNLGPEGLAEAMPRIAAWDPAELSEMAAEATEADDAPCYVTDLLPDELLPEELEEARRLHPEAFDKGGHPIVGDGWWEEPPAPAQGVHEAPAEKAAEEGPAETGAEAPERAAPEGERKRRGLRA